nr:MAG TPA: hypothetical protein [Caudoviricetes sp.]
MLGLAPTLHCGEPADYRLLQTPVDLHINYSTL